LGADTPHESEGLDFIVHRKNWRDTRFVPAARPGPLGDGQVLFRVDRFAFTANNISYALAGDMLRYWDFFPAREEGFGRIPVMGFADVVESRHPDVPVDQRCFGFYPMSRFLVIEPGSVAPEQIVDGVAHRAGLAPAYNAYTRVEADPGYSAAHEDQHMLMRGLFMTSFLVDDFCRDNDLFGASTIVISSASSKTSIALGTLVKSAGTARAVGLTSPGNAAFVESLGCYDDVVLYDDVETLPADEPTIFVDMAGNGDVVNRIHRHLRDQLVHSCQVGGTHWDTGGRDSDLPGAEPAFFFAPGQMQKRAKDWGPGGLQERMGESWTSFRDSTDSWLKITRGAGPADVERVYHDTLEGRAEPSQGNILSLWS